MFNFSNLYKNHETFSNKDKKVVGKLETETLKNIWLEYIVALRSKGYAFKSGDDSTNKMKGFSKSQTETIIFGEDKIVLDKEENVSDCDNYTLLSLNHDKYLQKKENQLHLFSMINEVI